MFLCACAATRARLKIVVRNAIGGYLYVSLVGYEAELAQMVVESAGVIVIHSGRTPLIAKENIMPPLF